MNFLGKVFIVLVLVLSILFMAFAAAVYTTHKNWQIIAQEKQKQLTDAQVKIQQLTEEHNRKVEQVEAEKLAAEQQAKKLEGERELMLADRKAIQDDLDQLRQQQRDRTAAIASTQQNNEALGAQVAALSVQKRDAELARDKQYGEMLAATEQRNIMVNQLENAIERNKQLVAQVANMGLVMQAHNINPTTDANTVTPTVDGVVSKIQRTGGTQWAEVSIGADDGLKAGDTVEVFRGSKYLGRINITETSPDKSVGEVNRRYLQGQIQEGDRVATRLNL